MLSAFYIDLIAVWVLCGLLAAGCYNAYIRKQSMPRSRKRFLQILMFSVAWGGIGGPLALAGVGANYLKTKAWLDAFVETTVIKPGP